MANPEDDKLLIPHSPEAPRSDGLALVTTYHEKVAAKLIEQLRQGAAPWQKPLIPGQRSTLLPYNPMTGASYRGMNIISLMAEERADPRWMTYNQARTLDAQVRKGEKGTTIQHWQFTETRDVLDQNGKPVLDAQGQKQQATHRLARPRVRFAAVFNAAQIDGLTALETPVITNPKDTIERANRVLAASGATIQHDQENRCFYRPASDTIHLPPADRFKGEAEYYQTVFHELGHWTGHASRLARDIAHPYGSEGYAKEELRAEIASLMISQDLELGFDPSQHTSYVGSWIKALQDDPREIFRAASAAEQIRGYVMNMTQTLTQTPVHNASTAEHPAGAELLEAGDRRYLLVPYAEKEQAKQQGARWDRATKAWYVPPGVDPDGFERWTALPQSQEALLAPPATLGNSSTKEGAKQSSSVRSYLAVPYGERELARAAGARWDAAGKAWYVGAGADHEKIARWEPGAQRARQEVSDPRAEFAAALKDAGAEVAGDHPIMDGGKHRIAVAGDKSSERAGFYVGHLDGVRPAGYFKNNRTSEEFRWKAKGYTLTDEQRARFVAAAASKLEERRLELQAKHEKCAQRVTQQRTTLRAIGADAPLTPYMESKGLHASPGVFTDAKGDTLFVPVVDITGKQWSQQYIGPDGTKRFAKDGRKEGCFHVVGGFEALQGAKAFIIAEGFATASTIHQSVKETSPVATIAAFDCGNLTAVATTLHRKFPNIPIIIAGDDDRVRQKNDGINPGREAALQAAAAVNGVSVFPTFHTDDHAALSDFNDLAQRSTLGAQALERQLTPILLSSAGVDQADDSQLVQALQWARKDGGPRKDGDPPRRIRRSLG